MIICLSNGHRCLRTNAVHIIMRGVHFIIRYLLTTASTTITSMTFLALLAFTNEKIYSALQPGTFQVFSKTI